MHVRKTAVLFALLVTLGAASASATTINFASLQAKPPDSSVPGALMAGTSYTTQGFAIGTCCVGGFDVWKLGNSNFPGTSPAATSLFEMPVRGNQTAITHGGQPFTLDSIDFAPLLSGGSGQFNLVVTGDFGDGSQITQTVWVNNSPFRLQTVKFSGFINVMGVYFSQGTNAGFFTGQETAYQFNNIVVNNRYVNGVNGQDSNDCLSVQTACQTIGHAISLASSGDSIMVAAATYKEHLTIGTSVNVLGAGASTTIVDGGSAATVVSVSAAAHVTLSGLTIRNGFSSRGGGIYNSGSLAVNNSTVTGNHVSACGGGIGNNGTLTINNSTISGNLASASGGGICQTGGTLTITNSTLSGNSAQGSSGGGIFNSGSSVTITNSTFSGNSAQGSGGGGIFNSGGTVTITNSTFSANSALASGGGGVYNNLSGSVTINNSTFYGNSAQNFGGGIYAQSGGTGKVTIQNSIVANSNTAAGNCHGTVTSNGYNLSGSGGSIPDTTCNFISPGDMNNVVNFKLGNLLPNGGPTLTHALLSGSPAIDAGNPGPGGCTDGHGHRLLTDQRGQRRPGGTETTGCDMGAYESQTY